MTDLKFSFKKVAEFPVSL